MSENGIMQAEQRVREMNMMARQFNEQGNRFMQQRQSTQSAQSAQSVQSPRAAQTLRGASPQRQQTTRFEPVEQSNRRQSGTYAPAGKGESFSAPRLEGEKPVRSTGSPADLSTLFSGFSMDGEKLMIMLLMYLLIKEKADIKIILALGYLLL